MHHIFTALLALTAVASASPRSSRGRSPRHVNNSTYGGGYGGDSRSPYAGTHSKWPTAHSVSVSNATAAIAPSQDPWYSAPDGFERARPGQILKIRNATATLAPKLNNTGEAYHILYRTTNGAYEPAWAVTTLLIPLRNISAAADRRKYLIYSIPYDSADVDASPSFSLYSGGGFGGDSEITAALGRGWVVSTADYEGPNAYFAAGVVAGHATIDSARAVLAANSPAKLSDDVRYAVWGYSGGALASEWALELAVQYAPELEFAGGALGGLTPNVTSVLYTINSTIYAGLAPAGIVGLLSQYPDTWAYLNDHLNPSGPYNATRFLATRNYTLLEGTAAYAGQNIFAYFTEGDAIVTEPPIQRAINRDGIMGYHGVPQPPLFVYKAIGDDVSPIKDTDILVERYCGIGATISYDRNTVGGHVAEGTNGDARAVAFLEAIAAGTYDAPQGCVIRNVTVPGNSTTT